ncbi:hypothetical protein DDB_G0279523 [Dictyostelium discoideum AX4]|uniref:Pesticidal crystal protein domain-containing protein n=1 Tax=Dictyostelium discoideum TaxID=44689 RepID=Q54WP0_DICDI|nr:hypothetical protein DDB_G0279523 [Dictyostelium discoideum AX4]EAL67700.1 hypothetical protein DDB_G0279523 [Dictyostelium discoideum AX4]|eukprot:XP_641677.1 hypothetical protein DDB_G0279523 [Dictyostelium discoideum AX4]
MATPNTFKDYYAFQLKMTQSLANSERPVINNFPFLGEKTNFTKEFAATCFLGAVGCIPNIGALLCNVVGFIFFPPSPNYNKELWDSIVSSVYNVANDVTSTLNNARVNGMVESIQGDFGKYYIAKNAFEKNKNIADINLKNKYRDDYLKQYDDLEDELLRKLAVLLNSPDQTKFEEISAFTILATTHLFVLKDGIKNGKTMGMTDAKIQSYALIYNSKLPIYFAHTRSAYNAGVKVIQSLPNLDNQTKYKRYLNYRNYCAQFVFDYVETWSCLDDIYPNGVYRENVRYLWDYAGVPIDETKPMAEFDSNPGDSYYQPSIAAMDKWMVDTGMERYKGELKTVDATFGQFFFINVQPSFLDETKPGLTRPEAVVGGNNSNKVPTKKATIPSGCAITGYTVSSDVLPRNLSIIPNVANNFVSFTPHKSWAIQRRSKLFSFLAMDECVEYSEVKDKTYRAHKLSTVTGKGNNRQIHTYEHFEQFNPGYDGFLDSLFFGFQPCNLFNDNHLFGNQATMINSQKTNGIPVDGVSLARDHVLPTVHSILVTKTKSLPFKFKYYDAKPVTTSYVFGIRYHSTTPVDISIRNADGVTQQLAMTLKPCTSDGKGTNEYKTQLATAVNLTDPRLTIVAVNNNVYIHSIVLIPSIPLKK